MTATRQILFGLNWLPHVMSLRKVAILLSVGTLVMIPLPTQLTAHSGATGIVKERMDQMKDMAGNLKIVAEMIRGINPFDAPEVMRASEQIGIEAKETLDLFPAGSTAHPSEAKAEIWSDWDKFEQLANDLVAATEQLALKARDATSVTDIQTEFNAMATLCADCHKTFRAKH